MTQEQEPVPPPWWPAVENILNEYGLQAIDFVADFKQALAQTQEPVAFASHGVINWIADKQFQHEADLYTTPPQRKPLTDEEITEHFQEKIDTGSLLSFADGVRFAEAAHGIKENK